MNGLFIIDNEYKRDDITAIAGARLREIAAAVHRFDHDHWCLILDEENSWGWKNQLVDGEQVVMGVNPKRPLLNSEIHTAVTRGERTWMFYRRRGAPRGYFRFLDEVRCSKQLGNFLVFEFAPVLAAVATQ